MSITSKFCRCDILSVEGAPLTETFRGMIRKEDIRAFEKDKVEVYKSFRPGDIVLARVVSLNSLIVLCTAELCCKENLRTMKISTPFSFRVKMQINLKSPV